VNDYPPTLFFRSCQNQERICFRKGWGTHSVSRGTDEKGGSLGHPPSSNSTGIVGDTQSISATVPDCLGTNESLVVNQGFSITIGGKVYDLSTVIQITKGNFNGVLRVDSVILKP